jgi:hypothetical protein
MSHAKTASKLVLGDRNRAYGNPKPDFERIARVWSGIIGEKLKRDITAADVPLMMVGLKLCRETFKPKPDNLIDAHGYLITAEWVNTGKKPSFK